MKIRLKKHLKRPWKINGGPVKGFYKPGVDYYVEKLPPGLLHIFEVDESAIMPVNAEKKPAKLAELTKPRTRKCDKKKEVIK